MSTVAGSTKEKAGEKRPLPAPQENADVEPLLLPSLYRLTAGLPRRELKLMASEALICEETLEKEIRILQEALEKKSEPKPPSVEIMMQSEITPPDRYFTVSALLGRLRHDLATPLPPNSTLPAIRAQSGMAPPSKKKKENNATATDASTEQAEPTSATSAALEKQKEILALRENPEYTKEHHQTADLLATWKKISTHRTSLVFRRPVNPKEAPGYTDRILFPMDLSLIRKMIVAKQIKSYSDLTHYIGLMAHNCVKYNGRESDYGLVARDFEAFTDEAIMSAVLQASSEKPAVIPSDATAAPSAPGSTAAPTPVPSSSNVDTKSTTRPTTNATDSETTPKPDAPPQQDGNTEKGTTTSTTAPPEAPGATGEKAQESTKTDEPKK